MISNFFSDSSYVREGKVLSVLHMSARIGTTLDRRTLAMRSCPSVISLEERMNHLTLDTLALALRLIRLTFLAGIIQLTNQCL